MLILDFTFLIKFKDKGEYFILFKMIDYLKGK